MGQPIKPALLQLVLLLLLSLLLFCCVVQTSGTLIDEGMVKGDLRRLAENLAPMYLPVSVSPSSPCGQALKDMATSLGSNSSLWPYKIVDSWGKTLDGVGMLNFLYSGNYDECVHTETGSGTGKYCKLRTYLPEDQRTTPRSPEIIPWRPDVPLARNVMNRHTRIASETIKTDPVAYSTCMPSVCTREELQESLIKMMLPQGVYINVEYCAVLKPQVEFTNPDIGFTSFLTFLVVLVVCASLVDMWIAYTGNRRLTKGVLRYLLVFSAYTNLGKILQVNPSPAPGTITCLNGMRVLSMTWVIYCHQITVPLAYMANIASYLTTLNGFLAQVILNGYPSVDTFFFLSGLLVSYSVLRAAKRTGGRFNVVLYFVHRLIRLIPPIGIVVGLVATVPRFFVSGPVANYWGYWYEQCQDNWWKDVLLVSNFLQETGECIGQTWYLGVDMQLYLVAPVIILPLYHYTTSGEAWLFLVTVFSAIIPAAITYKFDLAPALLQGQEGGTTDEFLKRYVMPWCRASPWLAGIWLGYFFYRQGNAQYKMSKLVVVTGWCVASLTGVLVVFGLYSYNQVINPLPYGVVTQIVYSGLHRLAWGAALAWMVFACHNGYGGVVNEFLSHPVWQPFSRLTYTTYLVALPLQYFLIYNLKQPYYYTHLNNVFSTLGALMFSILVAVCVSLLAESPVIGLERLLLRPAGSAAKTMYRGENDGRGVRAPIHPKCADVETVTEDMLPFPQPPAGPAGGAVFTVEKVERLSEGTGNGNSGHH